LATSFLDTSSVVKRYIRETGTAWVQAQTDPATAGPIYVARITLAEMVAAVTKRQRMGQVAAADAATALRDFRQDFSIQYRAIEISPGLVDHAADLAAKHGLRGYDAVQLAASLEVASLVPSLIFVSADVTLNRAAATEGLAVEDPNSHP
jgi:uncharacterized protein